MNKKRRAIRGMIIRIKKEMMEEEGKKQKRRRYIGKKDKMKKRKVKE